MSSPTWPQISPEDAGPRSSTLERGCVQQSAASAHVWREDHGIALKALPRRVATTAAAGARLMTDQHPVRAEPAPVLYLASFPLALAFSRSGASALVSV
jgi:hypothetical protein